MNKIAVILSGCGHLDGAEIREAVFTMLAIELNGNAKYDIFAPNQDQHHVINHLKGEEAGSSRNVLEESARIARGKIQPLEDFHMSNYQAVILPGGFGAAKNLSDFAFKGSAGSLNDKLKQELIEAHNNKKPIGAICISPAVVALALGDKGIKVTIGNDQDIAGEIAKTGADHEPCDANEYIWDEEHNIGSTPAYMYDNASMADIFTGIKSLVDKIIDEID